jgi:hypothetical protein
MKDMNRYITKSDVHRAADQINAQGRKPGTVEIRKILGSGSNSTIQMHLDTWKPQDQMEYLAPLPDSLMSTATIMVADAWYTATKAADERGAQAIEAANCAALEAQALTKDIEEQIDKLTAENAQLKETILAFQSAVEERDRQIVEYRDFTDKQIIEDAKKESEIEALRRAMSEFGGIVKASKASAKQSV